MKNLGSTIREGAGAPKRGGEPVTLQFVVERPACKWWPGYRGNLQAYPVAVWIEWPAATVCDCGAYYALYPGCRHQVCSTRGHLIE